MDNQASFNANWKFICGSCSAALEPDREMVRVRFTREKVIVGNMTELQREFTDFLCIHCLTAIFDEKMDEGRPDRVASALRELSNLPAHADARSGEGAKLEIMVDADGDQGGSASLVAHCSGEGLYFTLHCYDGESRATGLLFTWKQIAQMLIAMDPDMFGRLDEPLHRVFPENLERLGYSVPGWQK